MPSENFTIIHPYFLSNSAYIIIIIIIKAICSVQDPLKKAAYAL